MVYKELITFSTQERTADDALFVERQGTGKAPNPIQGEWEFWFICDCPATLQKCFGCTESLKKPGVHLQPPFDATIVTRGERFFTKPSGERTSQMNNVYFHINPKCIQDYTRKAAIADFVETKFTIRPDAMVKVGPMHRNALRSLWRKCKGPSSETS
jgi:hypothetical protein